jgi:Acetyltransferase (GNAT) domain
MARSFAAEVEERLLVPAYSSRWAFAPIAAHRGLSLPLQLVGQMRQRSLVFNGAPVKLIDLGREKLILGLATRLFGDLPSPTVQERRPLWNPAIALEHEADVILAEVHRWMASRFRRAGWVIVPSSVRWVGELATIPPPARSHGLRENLRKLRKYGFQIEQSGAAGDWDMFYSDMVRPQAVARHGSVAWLPSRTLLSEFARSGTLHFITQKGERVAGICTIPRGDTIWLAISGVRHGEPALLRAGAGFATVALAIEWARKQGYRRVDAGRTGPFTNDGLQEFKRRWGLIPVPDPLAHLIALKANSDVIRQAFADEPALVEGESGLEVYAGESS